MRSLALVEHAPGAPGFRGPVAHTPDAMAELVRRQKSLELKTKTKRLVLIADKHDPSTLADRKALLASAQALWRLPQELREVEVEVKPSDVGFGLFPARAFPPNTVLSEYTGLCSTRPEAEQAARDGEASYLFDLGGVGKMGSLGEGPDLVRARRTLSAPLPV